MLGGETQVGWNHQVVVVLNPYFPSIPITSFFLQCHNDHLSFLQRSKRFDGLSFCTPPPPKQKKLKRVCNLPFDSIHSHHQVTIRISMHMFLIFHGYLSKIQTSLTNLGQQTQKRGEQNYILPTLLNSVIMDELIPCSINCLG